MIEKLIIVDISTSIEVKAKDIDEAMMKAWEEIARPDFGADEWDHQYKMSRNNWRYCERCKQVFDLWKYDSLEDAGHEGHKLRMLTDEEYAEALKECEEHGCFEE